MNYGATTGAMAEAGIANAIKASGAIIRVDPKDFSSILERTDKSLVVMTNKTFWSGYKYLTSYKGLIFFTKSPERLMLPGDTEIISAGKIWIPS